MYEVRCKGIEGVLGLSGTVERLIGYLVGVVIGLPRCRCSSVKWSMVWGAGESCGRGMNRASQRSRIW